MNAVISVGVTNETGKVDVLVNHFDKRDYMPLTKQTVNRTRAHNNVTDASFVRMARLLAKHGNKTHEFGALTHYRVR